MLEILFKNDKLWRQMVANFGCPNHLVGDFVQEMYLRIHRLVGEDNRILYDDENVNKYYVYITLRNMYFDYLRQSNKYKSVPIYEVYKDDYYTDNEICFDEEYDYDKDGALSKISDRISKEVNSWEVYDAKLCDVYFKEGLSLREISKGSNISLTSIYNSIKNYRDKIQDKFGEDIEDFYNNNYDKV